MVIAAACRARCSVMSGSINLEPCHAIACQPSYWRGAGSTFCPDRHRWARAGTIKDGTDYAVVPSNKVTGNSSVTFSERSVLASDSMRSTSSSAAARAICSSGCRIVVSHGSAE